MRRLLGGLSAEADTVTFFLGALAIVVGVAMVFPPAAFVVAGLALCWFSISLSRSA